MDDDRSASPAGQGAPAGASVPATLEGEILRPHVRTERLHQAPPRPPWREVSPPFKLRLGTALAAFACVALLSSAVAGSGYALVNHLAAGRGVDPTAAALARLQQDLASLKSTVDTLHPGADLARQDETIRSLKKSVDVLKAEIDTGRGVNAAAISQLAAKLDRADRDPAPKLADITARLDRIEKQVSSPVVTGSIAAPAKATPLPVVPQTITAQTVEKPQPKPAVLDGWIVREVYDGIALVEGRSGGMREVTPGETIPGAGEVRSIERRGRNWVVVTSRGIIDTATW